MRHMSPKKGEKTRNTSISIPEDVWQDLKTRADKEERSVSAYVARLVKIAIAKTEPG